MNPAAKRWSALRSQGYVIFVLGLVASAPGLSAEHTLFERNFLSVVGGALMIGGAVLVLWASWRKTDSPSQLDPTRTDEWPSRTEQLVTVCLPTSVAEHIFVESVLREHDIPFVTQNAYSQNLIGIGQLGGVNVAIGPPEIQVSAADAPQAEAVLRTLVGESRSDQDSGNDGP